MSWGQKTWVATAPNGVPVTDDQETTLLTVGPITVPLNGLRVALLAFIEFKPESATDIVKLRFRRGTIAGTQLVIDTETAAADGTLPWVAAANNSRTLAWVDAPGEQAGLLYTVTIECVGAGDPSAVGDLALIATVF